MARFAPKCEINDFHKCSLKRPERSWIWISSCYAVNFILCYLLEIESRKTKKILKMTRSWRYLNCKCVFGRNTQVTVFGKLKKLKLAGIRKTAGLLINKIFVFVFRRNKISFKEPFFTFQLWQNLNNIRSY